MSIEAWRNARGYTQQEMADACKVHLNTYRYWEKKPRIIPIAKYLMILDKLEVAWDAVYIF